MNPFFYSLKETRNHYSKVLQTKSPLYYERFDRHILDKRPEVRKLVAQAFARLFPEKVGHMIHRFHSIECRTCFMRSTGSMR